MLVPEILQVTELQRVDDLAHVRTLRRVLFIVGPHGPFTLEIPLEQYTPEEVRRLMQLEADKLALLMPGG